MSAMTTYIPVPFMLCGVSCEAYARMVSEQKDGHTTQQYFIITAGDYIMAKWVPGGPLEFTNNSAANYHESNVLCRLNETHMREIVIPAMLSRFCPEGATTLKLVSPLPANTKCLVTPNEIDSLPENVRAYIHQLETRADPAGDVQRIAALEQQVKGLTARLASEKRQELVALTAAALTGLCANGYDDFGDPLATKARQLAERTYASIPR